MNETQKKFEDAIKNEQRHVAVTIRDEKGNIQEELAGQALAAIIIRNRNNKQVELGLSVCGLISMETLMILADSIGDLHERLDSLIKQGLLEGLKEMLNDQIVH